MNANHVILAGLAPAIWGSTFLVTTQMLPDGYPLHNAFLRALPAGLILLALSGTLPRASWLPRILILGVLNFSIFWWLLFVAAYRLPGGVAATVGSIQPLIVFALSGVLLGNALRWPVYLGGAVGVVGVGLLVLDAQAALDPIGIAAAVGGALSMGLGVTLSKRWQLPVPPLVFASWQLIAGGLLILPFALAFEPALPTLTATNVLGYVYLSLVGGAITYVLWFGGIQHIGPAAATTLGFLSPISAVLLGWIVLSESMTGPQFVGMALVLSSVLICLRLQSDRALDVPALAARILRFLGERLPLRNRGIVEQAVDPMLDPRVAAMSLRELADLPMPRPSRGI